MTTTTAQTSLDAVLQRLLAARRRGWKTEENREHRAELIAAAWRDGCTDVADLRQMADAAGVKLPTVYQDLNSRGIIGKGHGSRLSDIGEPHFRITDTVRLADRPDSPPGWITDRALMPGSPRWWAYGVEWYGDGPEDAPVWYDQKELASADE